jgi:hypothetical protein
MDQQITAFKYVNFVFTILKLILIYETNIQVTYNLSK